MNVRAGSVISWSVIQLVMAVSAFGTGGFALLATLVSPRVFALPISRESVGVLSGVGILLGLGSLVLLPLTVKGEGCRLWSWVVSAVLSSIGFVSGLITFALVFGF